MLNRNKPRDAYTHLELVVIEVLRENHAAHQFLVNNAPTSAMGSIENRDSAIDVLTRPQGTHHQTQPASTIINVTHSHETMCRYSGLEHIS
jgi:hypothetical protein